MRGVRGSGLAFCLAGWGRRQNARPDPVPLGIGADQHADHHNHFHVTIETPRTRLALEHLYAEGAAEANTGFTERAENLQITAQALLAQVEPQLIFQQGDLTMFVMDMPPDVPPQYAPVVVAQVSQAQQGPEVDRIIGVCHLATNNEELKHSAINGVAPVGAAWGYLNQVETRKVPLSGTMDVLSEPKHGKLEQVHDSKGRHVGYRYLPTSAYVGEDSATFLVEIGGYTVKVIYFFNVMPYVAPGSEEYDPYEDPNLCPKGDVWKVQKRGQILRDPHEFPHKSLKTHGLLAATFAPDEGPQW